VLIAAAVYTTSCSVLMGLIPAPTLAASTAPFADAATLLLGTSAGAFVAVLALVKTIGTLGGWILITAQTSKAGADRGLFPAVFGWADRHGTPVPALLLMAVVMSVVVLATMSPSINEQFSKLIELSTLFCLLAYVYACIALWRMDRPGQGPRAWAHVHYRVLAVAAALACVGIIAESAGSLLKWSAATVALTIPLYWLLIRPLRQRAFGNTAR
jgi:arginine:agmatine antiporter